jgi:hypothetical protein
MVIEKEIVKFALHKMYVNPPTVDHCLRTQAMSLAVFLLLCFSVACGHAKYNKAAAAADDSRADPYVCAAVYAPPLLLLLALLLSR